MKTAFSHLVAHTKDVELVLINSEYMDTFSLNQPYHMLNGQYSASLHTFQENIKQFSNKEIGYIGKSSNIPQLYIGFP